MDKAIILIQEEVINLHNEMNKQKIGTALWRANRMAAIILEDVLKKLKEEQSNARD